MALFIENDFLRVGVKEHGAELTSVKNRRGYEYIWQGDEKFWAKQCPVLFPICGRLHKKTYRYNGKVYKMESHGFASRSDFKAEKISDTEMAFTLKENEETLEQYPFRFVFSVRYRLETTASRLHTKRKTQTTKRSFSTSARTKRIVRKARFPIGRWNLKSGKIFSSTCSPYPVF